MNWYIGLMSGTSMDGIDAALVDIPTNTLLCGLTKRYSDEVKKRLDKLLKGSKLSLAAVCQLNTLIGREFAAAANALLLETKTVPNQITAIGSHGQTVCHNTHCSIPYTLQLGCGHTISSLTQIKVVADFRTRDLVHAGQGAPFAPLYHQELFSHRETNTAVVNIGGISNISFINAHQPVKGWDIGPGNCLMDAWISRHQGRSYDDQGSWARQGQIIRPLLEQLIADSFIGLAPPKSIGKEYFSLLWLARHLKKEYQPVDVQKTLLAFTAQTIVDTILSEKLLPTSLYLCGGGTHNLALFEMLRSLLPQIDIKSIADLGINPDYLEAMIFAWLAAQSLHQIPVDLTTITGAKIPAVLGAIYPI